MLPEDVDAVLHKLKIPWFVTAGHSGGGPHALACGARLKRCRAVATIAGVAPYEMDDLDFLDGMGPENIDEFGAALSSEIELREWLDRNCTMLRDVTGRQLAKALGGLVTQSDKDALAGAFADRIAGSIRRGIARTFDGWVDDDRAFVSDWGFTPADVTVPTTIWHGESDLMVPAPHGVWLAKNIPVSELGVAPRSRSHVDPRRLHRIDSRRSTRALGRTFLSRLTSRRVRQRGRARFWLKRDLSSRLCLDKACSRSHTSPEHCPGVPPPCKA